MSQPKEIYAIKMPESNTDYGQFSTVKLLDSDTKYHHDKVVKQYKRNHDAVVKFAAALLAFPSDDGDAFVSNVKTLLNEIDVK